MEQKYIDTHEFIKRRWKDGLRETQDPDYPLPFPFEPPCVDGLFQYLFYWDTFFTNRGLILDGEVQIAKWNTDNLIYLLKKYGYVPNSNSYPGIKHNSQPPYLQYMIEDIYNATHDKKWLEDAYFALKMEYDFWMTQRMTKIGLNQYLHHPKTDEEKIEFFQYVANNRIAEDPNAPREYQIRAGSSYNASGESGIDLTPAIGIDGPDMVEVDLNSHLYSMELKLAKWAKEFEPEFEDFYLVAAEYRKELMNRYMFDKKTGLYFDYNFVKGEFEQTNFHFTCQWLPFIIGLSTDKKACKLLLSKLEYEFGCATTEKYEFKFDHQGAYPYSWPFDNYYAYRSLMNCGLKEDAERVAMKYLTACANSYTKTGHLWEVYSAIVDEVATKNEYPNAEMLGWTAGVYQYFYNELKK